ncbi:MAG: hypothetical protein AB7U85_07565 [Alphaproteobacteria bacterium]
MTVSTFLNNHIQNCASISLQTIEKYSNFSDIRTRLYKLVTRKDFRKWALDESAVTRIKTAINYSLENKTPLKFVLEFGGYKLWRLPSAPSVDFAELFMLCHYINFLAPIAHFAPYGVCFYFASDDVVVSRMNNIKPDAMNQYCSSFNLLLKILNPYLPHNLKIELTRLATLYSSQNELEDELAITFANNKKKFLSWSDEKKEKMLKRAELNFCKNGNLALKDLSKISSANYLECLNNGAIYHDAFEDCQKRQDFVLGEDSILVFCSSIPEALAIGSSKTSVTKFWTGTGVLQKNENSYIPRILSPSNFQKLDKNQLSIIDIKWELEMPDILNRIILI